jgi:hypothetical protein
MCGQSDSSILLQSTSNENYAIEIAEGFVGFKNALSATLVLPRRIKCIVNWKM